VSGCTLMEIVEAAHIKPHAEQPDDDPANGLLLRADLHTLFDLHLIGIEPDTLTGPDKTLSGNSKVMMPDTEANHTDCQRVPRLLDHRQAIIADAHTPKSLQPTDRPLDYPTHFPQAAAVAALPFIDLRLDPQPGQQPAGGFAVVACIGVQLVGVFLRPSYLATDMREVQDDGNDFFVVTGIGSGCVNRHRYAVAVHQQRVFGAFFRPVHGTGASEFAATEGSHDHTIHDDEVRIELVVLAQQAEEIGMEPIPDARMRSRIGLTPCGFKTFEVG